MLAALKMLPEDSVRATCDSPVGGLTLIASKRGLHALLFPVEERELRRAMAAIPVDNEHPVIVKTVKQLAQYFAGKRKSFELPLAAIGTQFQKQVWRELSKIPYGKTISYGEQAKRIGDAKKARAVGTANSRNPIAIVVPCHRVIASTGDLSGFGGGVSVKKYLLNLEAGV